MQALPEPARKSYCNLRSCLLPKQRHHWKVQRTLWYTMRMSTCVNRRAVVMQNRYFPAKHILRS